MRCYGIVAKKHKEEIMFNMTKMKCGLLQHLHFSSKKREFYKSLNEDLMEPQDFLCKFNYSIPQGKHCIPVGMVTSDLVLRENITQLKEGVKRLLSNHYSHKFLGGFKSLDEVLMAVDAMDNTLTWHYSSFNVGRFDFDSVSTVSPYVSHFDLLIREVNDSYLAVEIHLYFTVQYTNDLQKIIISDIDEPETYLTSSLTYRGKKSGGKRTFTPVWYNTAYQKSDILYESITVLKWHFFDYLQRFFPTMLHRLDVMPPGMLFYQTNIDYRDTSATRFWESIGVQMHNGQFIDSAQKIFFNTKLSGRYSEDSYSDMLFIFHDEKMNISGGYSDIGYQVVHNFCQSYLCDFFKIQFLDICNTYFSKELVQYKNKLNKIKLRKKRLHSLLKLRYVFERKIDLYKRLVKDPIWDDCKNRIENVFESKTMIRSFNYTHFVGIPIESKNRIMGQIETITDDFAEKEAILQHLENYTRESRNQILNFVMFLMAAITLALVIFPDWSKSIATFLTSLWTQILSFAKTAKGGLIV